MRQAELDARMQRESEDVFVWLYGYIESMGVRKPEVRDVLNVGEYIEGKRKMWLYLGEQVK